MPSAPLFPFQEAPGKAEPGNQEVPWRDTSCRRRYGNGPRLPQGGSPGTPPPRRRPRPPHRPPTVAAAAAAGAAILARPSCPFLPGGTCAAPTLPPGALPPPGFTPRPSPQPLCRMRVLRTGQRAGIAAELPMAVDQCGVGHLGAAHRAGAPFASGAQLLPSLETLPTALGFLLDSVSSSVKWDGHRTCFVELVPA